MKMASVMREFQIERNLSDEELLAVACEVLLMRDRRVRPLLKKLEENQEAFKDEPAWQREVTRRALAQELYEKYRPVAWRWNSPLALIRRDAFLLAKEVLKERAMSSLFSTARKPRLTTWDAIRILRILHEPSKLARAFEEGWYWAVR